MLPGQQGARAPVDHDEHQGVVIAVFLRLSEADKWKTVSRIPVRSPPKWLRRFGGIKWLENVRFFRIGYSGPGISDHQPDVRTGVQTDRPGGIVLCYRHAIGSDKQSTPGRHRISGIQDQIDDHLA